MALLCHLSILKTFYVNRNAYHALLSLRGVTWTVDESDQLPEGVQPQLTVDELFKCEEAVQNDPVVQKLAKEVGMLRRF